MGVELLGELGLACARVGRKGSGDGTYDVGVNGLLPAAFSDLIGRRSVSGRFELDVVLVPWLCAADWLYAAGWLGAEVRLYGL